MDRLTDENNFLFILPSYFSTVEKIILLIDKFNPIPIASDATRTSYPESGALNNLACSFLASGGRPPLIVRDMGGINEEGYKERERERERECVIEREDRERESVCDRKRR